jgi:hypothetical protein
MGTEHVDEAREGELVNDMPANVTPLHAKRGAEEPQETPAERKARQKRQAEG